MMHAVAVIGVRGGRTQCAVNCISETIIRALKQHYLLSCWVSGGRSLQARRGFWWCWSHLAKQNHLFLLCWPQQACLASQIAYGQSAKWFWLRNAINGALCPASSASGRSYQQLFYLVHIVCICTRQHECEDVLGGFLGPGGGCRSDIGSKTVPR